MVRVESAEGRGVRCRHVCVCVCVCLCVCVRVVVWGRLLRMKLFRVTVHQFRYLREEKKKKWGKKYPRRKKIVCWRVDVCLLILLVRVCCVCVCADACAHTIHTHARTHDAYTHIRMRLYINAYKRTD